MIQEDEEYSSVYKNGFSLIEVIAAVAILSFLILAICTFMTTGSNMYKKSNVEIDLQQEAQTTMNQLNDMLLPANHLQVKRINELMNNEIIALCSYSLDESNAKAAYCIIWKKDVGKIYFIKKDSSFVFDGTDTQILDLCSVVNDEANLLGRYVKDLKVDTTNLTMSQVIKLTIDFAIKDDHFKISKEIKLRNRQT